MTSHGRALARSRFVLVLAMAFAALGARCDPPATSDEVQGPASKIAPKESNEITRERAIEIARKQVSFKPESVEAVQVISEGPEHRTVWRVTFTGRLPDQLPGLFETRIFEIDLRTGDIIGASMN